MGAPSRVDQITPVRRVSHQISVQQQAAESIDLGAFGAFVGLWNTETEGCFLYEKTE